MPQLAVQTHTLRNLDVDIATKLERIAGAGYDGAQFTPALGETSVDELAALLDEHDLAVAGCHIDRSQFESDYEGTLDRYRTISCSDMVIPSYGRDGFADEAGVEAAIADVKETAERFSGDGVRLHYHNHSYEFQPFDGETAFDAFAEGTAGHLGLEIDTGLAYRGDADPASLIDRYAERVDLIHVTDTIPGDNATAHVDLGDGEVDLAACLDAAVAADVSWLIYENGRTDDPFASIEDAATFMQDHL